MRKYLSGQPNRPASGSNFQPEYQGAYGAPRRPWPIRVLRSLGRILRGTIMLIGTVGLLTMLLGLYGMHEMVNKRSASDLPAPTATGPTVLFWPMDAAVPDVIPGPSISNPFGTGSDLTTRTIADRLFEAAEDQNIRALYLSYRGAGVDLAQVEEWRPALQAMRKAGKKLVFFAPDLGMGPGAMDVYLLATEFDRVVMMPTSSISMTGMAVEMPFARDTLDKLGVTPQIVQRKEYKTAFENLTASQMSDANREMTASIITTIYNDMVSHMAQNRKIPVAQVQAQIDRAIITAEEAKAAGLIDAVNYSDKEIEALGLSLVSAVPDPASREAAADGVGFIELADYQPPGMAVPRKPTLSQILRGQKPQTHANPNLPKIALIDLTGTIVMTDGKSSNMAPMGMGGGVADAVGLVEAIATASGDPQVGAIVLRVDSPGGSPVASEVIRNSIVKAKTRGKKVYISMGTAAASGGYWVSADADKIYALPSTMTGSIGVIGGKFVFSGIWDKLGVSWETIAAGGANAGMWSINTPFTPEQLGIFARSMDNTYADFTSRVAKGRKLDPAQVENIARGRVWLGSQAIKIGLVDGLKTYRQVQDQALADLGLTRKQVNFVQLPEPPNPFEAIARLLGTSTSGASMSGASALASAGLPPSVVRVATDLAAMQSALAEGGLRGAVIAPSVVSIRP